MLRYAIRRTLLAIPTLVVMSIIFFFILKSAPGDPTSNLPLEIPAEVRERQLEALGVNDPFFISWGKWMRSMVVAEPLHAVDQVFGTCIGDCENRERMISWQSRAPAMDIVYERLPQTLWVMGVALILGILLAVPIGIYSAYRQYSAFDNVGTVVTTIGFSAPVYFTGLILITIFAVRLRWLGTIYDTTHSVSLTSWSSIWTQIKQMLMPVAVLTLFNAASLSRFTRASVLDNLNQDFVRTARSKGLGERTVVLRHVVRNSLIPVVTLIALQVPGIFAGAIITESLFKINGLGSQLLLSIRQGDLFMVQTLVFIFAVLVVAFNLLADLLYGLLDPRIRYD